MVVTVVRYAALLLLLLCQLSLAQVPESIPEAEGEPEGKPEGEPIPEGEAPPYAEPEPQWETAKVIWGLAWKVMLSETSLADDDAYADFVYK